MTATIENPAFNGWITAKGGIRFDLLNPDPDHLDIRTIAHAIGNVCRFSGHTSRHYSVAQHSILVSELVTLLGGLDGDAYTGLMHDAQEAYVGDVPTPLKRLLPEYKRIEDGIAARIADRYHVAAPLPQIVKDADLYALYLERDELMPEQPEPWEHEHLAEEARDLLESANHGVAGLVTEAWQPEYASEMFLLRFAQLAPEKAR